MCLIFYRDVIKATAKLDLDILEEANYSNPDGVGVAYVHPKTKSWDSWRSVRSSWKSIAKRLAWLDANTDRWAVHFRYATAGSKTVDNAHPFQIADDVLLMHNGVLTGVHERDDKSDTRQLAERLSACHAAGGQSSLLAAWRAVKLLGHGNRFLLTLPKGRVQFAGDWVSRPEGKYSNSSCLYTSWRKPAIGYAATTATTKNRVNYRSTATAYWHTESGLWERYDFDRKEWMLCEYDAASRKYVGVMSIAEWERNGKVESSLKRASHASANLGHGVVDLVHPSVERDIKQRKSLNGFYLLGQEVAYDRKLERWYYVDSYKLSPSAIAEATTEDFVEPTTDDQTAMDAWACT